MYETTHVLSNFLAEFRKYFDPRVLRGTLHKIISRYLQRSLAGMFYQPLSQVFRMKIDMICDALSNEKPNHVRRQGKRAMVVESEVDCCHQRVKPNTIHHAS